MAGGLLSIMHRLYPKAHQPRPRNPTGHQKRLQFLKLAGANFIILQLLFFALFAYIFGSINFQSSRIHNLKVLYVDYDEGDVGTSVLSAYNQLNSDAFPSLVIASPSDYPAISDIRDAVCNIRYWGAIYTAAGASDRLHDALRGGLAASEYDPTDAMGFVWNEARYSAIVDSDIQGTLQTLADGARLVYTGSNSTNAIQTLNATDLTAVSVFTNPWQLKSINIQPTTQGSRLVYNTLVIILILIQEFFFLGTINGLTMQLKIHVNMYPYRIVLLRTVLSVAYCFVGSLCTVGAIWAFRSDWNVNGAQFVLSWMILWLFAHLNFLTLDVFSIWLPPPLIPMSLITWVIFNVSSILVPFELSNSFYSWAYVMPAHEVYQILTDIWSGGCNPQLQHALPVLFIIELSSFTLSVIGVYRRCHHGVIADEAAEEAFQNQLNKAVSMEVARREAEREREREKEVQERRHAQYEPEAWSLSSLSDISLDERRDELNEITEIWRSHRASWVSTPPPRFSWNPDFGPSFSLAF